VKATLPQIRSALARPSPDLRLYLLYGPDEAGAGELAAVLARAMGADAERIDLEGSALRSDPARLADEAAAMSLFGGARHIRIQGAGDDCIEAVAGLLSSPRAGNPVVAIGPSLRGTSKLVKLALDSSAALAFACYVPEGRGAEQIAAQIAAEHGLRPVGRVTARLVEASGGDRAVMAREIEKLALYLDAAPDRIRELDDAAFEAVGADLAEAAAADAIAAIVEGRPDALGIELRRLTEANVSTILWLRQLGGRLRALAEMRAEIDRGASPGEVVKRHRIHFREEPVILRALGRWTSAMLGRAIEAASRAEREQRSGGMQAGEITAATWAIEAARHVEARR
jgi:DNA polymerase-3 subunit delta